MEGEEERCNDGGSGGTSQRAAEACEAIHARRRVQVRLYWDMLDAGIRSLAETCTVHASESSSPQASVNSSNEYSLLTHLAKRGPAPEVSSPAMQSVPSAPEDQREVTVMQASPAAERVDIETVREAVHEAGLTSGTPLRDGMEGIIHFTRSIAKAYQIYVPNVFAGNEQEDSTAHEDICEADKYGVQDPKYVMHDQDGSWKITHTVDHTVMKARMLRKYFKTFSKAPELDVRESRNGRGLFVKKGVRSGGIVCEYTGVRVSGVNKDRMMKALRKYDEEPDVLVAVEGEDAIIDPRFCGNEAQFANHSCQPNCELDVITIGEHSFVVIRALRPIKAGEEVTIDYRWCSHRTSKPVLCDCGQKRCRVWI